MAGERVSTRELIESYRREIRDTDLQPDRAAELLTKLSALYGNVNDEIREADMDYNVVLLKHLEGEEAANRAKIRAQTTPEYMRAREAKDTLKVVDEMTRSLKYFLKAKEGEWRATR